MYSVWKMLLGCLVTITVIVATAFGDPLEDGKWDPQKYGKGKYVHKVEPYIHNVEPYDPEKYGKGKYVHNVQPYVHDVEPYDPDKYGKGKYVHDVKPYDGGYGEYIHDYVPFVDTTLWKGKNWKYWSRCRCW